MKTPSKKTIEYLRKEYPTGSRVELVRMEDVQAPPKGMLGTVIAVDDAGTIHVSWDNGSSLGIAYGEDQCRKSNMRICPKCGRYFSEHPAISREDNSSEICPDCGFHEAITDWFNNDKNLQRQLFDAIEKDLHAKKKRSK